MDESVMKEGGAGIMPRILNETIQFDTKASRPKHAIVMIYDIAGFSKFFNQPDVHEYVPRFLNHISDAISTIIYGGEAYWLKKPREMPPLTVPVVHEKFLGDGGLYIWLSPKEKGFSRAFITNLCNRLWFIQANFKEILKKCVEFIPVYELPNGIRFGLARGTVYQLTNQNTRENEYIGFCINLASRLQKYCSELAFIASARTEIPDSMLSKYSYIRVVATKLKGFPKEVVVVDEDEYDVLPEEVKLDLFESPSE